MPDCRPGPMRLPRNFHRTFVPERQYIRAMLAYAASGRAGTVQEISQATGVPTGASTGKVPAILDYCRGMGLVELAGPARSAAKRPQLTTFGRTVLLEDPYLKESVTQWVAHFALCGSLTGADAWYQTFFVSTRSLGMRFPRERLEDHLAVVYGTGRAGLIGPMVRTYEAEAALRTCGALSENAGVISRRAAPIEERYGPAYGAWLLQLMQDHCPGVGQVSATELDARGGWRTIPGWDADEAQRALGLVERKGTISVDRQMHPWLLRPETDLDDAWKRIYDDLV